MSSMKDLLGDTPFVVRQPMPRPDLSSAQVRAENGMRQAVDHANRASPGWAAQAYNFLRQYALSHERYTSEDISDAAAADPLFPPTTDRRAWGAIVQKAARNGIHVRDGFAPRRHGNCSPGPRWRSLISRIEEPAP